MKQTKTLAIIAMAGAMLATSCASKKELQNCQTENKELTGNYQAAKEQLAASQARVTTLEDQLAQMKTDYILQKKSAVHQKRGRRNAKV